MRVGAGVAPGSASEPGAGGGRAGGGAATSSNGWWVGRPEWNSLAASTPSKNPAGTPPVCGTEGSRNPEWRHLPTGGEVCWLPRTGACIAEREGGGCRNAPTAGRASSRVGKAQWPGMTPCRLPETSKSATGRRNIALRCAKQGRGPFRGGSLFSHNSCCMSPSHTRREQRNPRQKAGSMTGHGAGGLVVPNANL